jgi:phosphoglucomutase
MVTVTLEGGVVFTLRASGTEPKLKYYSELAGAWADRSHVDATLAAVVAAAVETLVQPARHGLTP